MLSFMNAPTKTPLTLLTGASRGLGLGLAQQLLARGHRLLTLQRTPNLALSAYGSHRVEQWSVDLRDPVPVAQRLSQWLATQDAQQVSCISIIHNAALLVEPGPLSEADVAQISAATRASLEAPLVLTAAFLKATASWPVPRKVLSISSGLGRHAMAGSAVYCAVKAGMDHYSRALAMEEALQPNGAKVVSLAPGIIDTDMQVQLRSADRNKFPEGARFAGFKSEGRLDSPESAGAKIVSYLERADFGAQVIADVRDAA